MPAFHPGTVTGRSLNLVVGDQSVSLVSRRGESWVDLERPEWQIVEISLAAEIGVTELFSLLNLNGSLEGTFYLDDVRLVASKLPASTALRKARTSTLPQAFTLQQNFPNPFNSETMIRFALPVAGQVKLALFNLAGHRVATLVQGMRDAGTYTVRWDGRDDAGRALAGGVYLYRLQVGNGKQVETRKLLLLR